MSKLKKYESAEIVFLALDTTDVLTTSVGASSGEVLGDDNLIDTPDVWGNKAWGGKY